MKMKKLVVGAAFLLLAIGAGTGSPAYYLLSQQLNAGEKARPFPFNPAPGSSLATNADGSITVDDTVALAVRMLMDTPDDPGAGATNPPAGTNFEVYVFGNPFGTTFKHPWAWRIHCDKEGGTNVAINHRWMNYTNGAYLCGNDTISLWWHTNVAFNATTNWEVLELLSRVTYPDGSASYWRREPLIMNSNNNWQCWTFTATNWMDYLSNYPPAGNFATGGCQIVTIEFGPDGKQIGWGCPITAPPFCFDTNHPPAHPNIILTNDPNSPWPRGPGGYDWPEMCPHGPGPCPCRILCDDLPPIPGGGLPQPVNWPDQLGKAINLNMHGVPTIPYRLYYATTADASPSSLTLLTNFFVNEDGEWSGSWTNWTGNTEPGPTNATWLTNPVLFFRSSMTNRW